MKPENEKKIITTQTTTSANVSTANLSVVDTNPIKPEVVVKAIPFENHETDGKQIKNIDVSSKLNVVALFIGNFAKSQDVAAQQIVQLDHVHNQKWYHFSINVYENILNELNENSDYFSKFIETIFKPSREKFDQADELAKKISDYQQFLLNEKKRLRIFGRKFCNWLIIFWLFFIIGFFFLGFYIKNRRIIREFNESSKNIKHKQHDLNEQKIQCFDQIYQHLPTIGLLNCFLDYFGIRIVHEKVNLNVHNLVNSSDKSLCNILFFLPFKIANQLFVNYTAVDETWRDVVSVGSVECPYEDFVYDDSGDVELVTEYETVTAEHVEPTPFRETTSYVITNFDCDASQYKWQLLSLNQTCKRKQNFLNKKQNHNDDQTMDVDFSHYFRIRGVQINDLRTQTIVNSYLTLYSQEIILKIHQFYENNLVVMNFSSGVFQAPSYLEQLNFFTWQPISKFLRYRDFKIDANDTLVQIKRMFLSIVKNLLHLPSYLWAMDTAANNMLNSPKKEFNFGSSYTPDVKAVADLETVISLANIHNLLSAINNKDAFWKYPVLAFKDLFKIHDVDVYHCEFCSYYATNLLDVVPVSSINCGIVDVPVPYVKYTAFTEEKYFLVTVNKSEIIGCFSFLKIKEYRQELKSLFVDNLQYVSLICTPSLKVIVVNFSATNEQLQLLATIIDTISDFAS